MGSDVFEVGLFKPDATGNEPVMLPRTWDRETLLRSGAWLKHQNRDGRNVYVRPKGEHNLSLVDDLSAEAVRQMKKTGFAPALIVQTSPGNFQAWLKHPEPLTKELSTAVARELATKFGGDRGAADWRHFGRLAGFTNRKDKYRGQSGLYPFVLLREHSGSAYDAAPQFIAEVRSHLEAERVERQKIAQVNHARLSNPGPLKSIESFRNDGRYGRDGTRVDLAYAVYAFSHGIDANTVTSALRSRDLSHKGSEQRQTEYIARTIRKALSAIHAPGHGR